MVLWCLNSLGKYKLRQKTYLQTCVPSEDSDQPMYFGNLGPVVQSIVSLMSSLRVISLTVLADSVYNILIFFAEKNVTKKLLTFFQQTNFSIFAYHSI